MEPQLTHPDINSSKRFDPLLQALSQKNTKVVVALGGGGVKMFAHTAVFQFLESLGAEKFISEIWGASGGAILGFCYSMGIKPEEIRRHGLEVFQGNIISNLPSGFSIAKKMLKDFFWPSKRRQASTVFQNYQGAVLRFLQKISAGKTPIHKFYCTAYNLEAEENDVLTSEEVYGFKYPDTLYQVPILDAVAASSAFPILFDPKVIEDKFGKRTYIDGAMVEDVPTASVYKKWLREKELGLEKRRQLIVIAVNLSPNLFSSFPSLDHWFIKRIPGYEKLVMSLNCAHYMHKARTKAQKRLLREDPNVELWDINLSFPGKKFLSLDISPNVFEIAYQGVLQQFAQINDGLLF